MTENQPGKPRVLFVAESVTLAHFARPISLAKQLDDSSYEVFLASDERFLPLVSQPQPFEFRSITSIPSQQFKQALYKGQPLYDAKTLTTYVEQDLKVLEEIQPDVVVGDFRLSLAVSAPKVGIPYAAVVNAYWSPYAELHYPVPDLPFVRFTGLALGQQLFDLVRPVAFALHALPLNRVRRRYGLPPLANDLREVYSWGDYTLYPDLPDAVPMRPLPSNHRFIGPVTWSTETPLPGWWDNIPSDRPVVYVSIGSSGRSDTLDTVLGALATLPVTVIAATAGNATIKDPPKNAFLADYLPGDLATKRADLVVCNGGSLTTYQALSVGIPIVGIATNMDQLLNMQTVEGIKAGVGLRAASITRDSVLHAVESQLARRESAAGEAPRDWSGTNLEAGSRFNAVLQEICR